MSGQQGGGGGGDDKHSMTILWAIFLIFFVGWVIWWAWGSYLLQAFIWLRILQAKAIYYTWGMVSNSTEPAQILYYAMQLNPQNITMDIAEKLSTSIGNYLRWPTLVILGGFTYYTLTRHAGMRYKKIHSMNTLKTQERVLWPQIEPVVHLDLVNTDLDTGPWAMAMTPMDFAKKHKLLEVKVQPMSSSNFGKGPTFKATLIHSKVDRLFAAQLGRNWMGPDKMARHRRAVFAIFAARVCRDAPTASKMVNQLALSASKGKLDTTGIDQIMIKFWNKSREIQELCAQHAYEFTVMYSMMLKAREDGVLAAADLIWLKPIDRRLWFVLDTVGRQTPFVECAGIHAHWLAEKGLQRALSVPMVKEATKALELAINEIMYIPDTPEERDELIKKHNQEQGR